MNLLTTHNQTITFSYLWRGQERIFLYFINTVALVMSGYLLEREKERKRERERERERNSNYQTLFAPCRTFGYPHNDRFYSVGNSRYPHNDRFYTFGNSRYSHDDRFHTFGNSRYLHNDRFHSFGNSRYLHTE